MLVGQSAKCWAISRLCYSNNTRRENHIWVIYVHHKRCGGIMSLSFFVGRQYNHIITVYIVGMTTANRFAYIISLGRRPLIYCLWRNEHARTDHDQVKKLYSDHDFISVVNYCYYYFHFVFLYLPDSSRQRGCPVLCHFARDSVAYIIILYTSLCMYFNNINRYVY
jgi:hypothetical protein